MAFFPDEAELDRLIDKAKTALIDVVDHFFDRLHGETIPLMKKEVLGLRVDAAVSFTEKAPESGGGK
jgi:hypothetical protein